MRLLLLGFLLSGALTAQPFSSLEENRSWVEAIRDREQGEQLWMLRERLLADTSLHVGRFGDRVILPPEDKLQMTIGPCRPVLVLEGRLVQITDDTSPTAIRAFSDMLTHEAIDSVVVVDDEIACAIYGTNGCNCGVIILQPKNRRIGRRLLRVIR